MTKLRLAMVGGGPGSSIGPIHRYAAKIDSCYKLIGGVFSRDYNKSLSLAKKLRLNLDRVYRNYEEMFSIESVLPEDMRIQVVAIVTPNSSHFPIAIAALNNGFHIMLEKPITISLPEALDLRDCIKKSNRLCCVNFTNIGYPMVKAAREMVKAGDLGNIRKVYVEFFQEWMATDVENKGNKQAIWRNNPSEAGPSGTMADTGSHAFNLIEYITQLKITEVLASFNHLVEGRILEDDATALLRFEGRATGILAVGQALIGEDVSLNIRVYGDKGSLKWSLTKPQQLELTQLGQPMQIFRSGINNNLLSENALHDGRTPGGPGEGTIEAVANHYRNFAFAINNNQSLPDELHYYPSIEEGVRSIAFIKTAIDSSQIRRGEWVSMPIL